MFYLNTIKQLFLFVEQLFQLEVCLAYSRLLAGIPILAVFQNSSKTPLANNHFHSFKAIMVLAQSFNPLNSRFYLWSFFCPDAVCINLVLKIFASCEVVTLNISSFSGKILDTVCRSPFKKKLYLFSLQWQVVFR